MLHNAWFLACWLASSMYVLLAGCVASHSKQSILPCLYSKATDSSPLLFGRWSAVAVICVKDSHGWPGKEQQTFLLCLKKRLPRLFPFLLAWVCARGEETDNCCVSPSKIVSLLSILLEQCLMDYPVRVILIMLTTVLELL